MPMASTLTPVAAPQKIERLREGLLHPFCLFPCRLQRSQPCAVAEPDGYIGRSVTTLRPHYFRSEQSREERLVSSEDLNPARRSVRESHCDSRANQKSPISDTAERSEATVSVRFKSRRARSLLERWRFTGRRRVGYIRRTVRSLALVRRSNGSKRHRAVR
jgi:hypothetical protein